MINRCMKKHTTEIFLLKSNEKHSNKYDYSKTIYKTSHDVIEVICPKHGSFFQKAYHHLNYGCKKCGDEIGTSKRKTSLEKFIEKAKIKHGERYDYSLVNFFRQHDL